ncbi:hypothetical protein CK203_033832 [Vitis vinifera]|uniref:Uncharacterized protein n=1 Tax=Vitis vinifera TaxID=29760 RepID=A0A438IQJ7_VITVI|nr:hypothetical protein CK203_033832 [Vitis vinifera]
MYVELTTPRIAAWNDFLVKQRIKLELEMLGGFGNVELVSTSAEQDETEKNKAPAVDDPVDPDENEDFDVICAHMEATQRQITDEQSHLNSLIASYNRDVKVLRTRFTSSHYRTDEGQPSNFHEHVNESGAPFYTNNPQHSPVHSGGQRRSSKDDLGCTNEGVSERPNVEDGVFFSNEDPLHPGPHNIEMLCAYGGYGVTREQLQCLVGENFIDIPIRCHTGMYAILYMQHWDGSGLNKTINSERMSLERLKFATHMEVTDKLIEEDEFDADQKDAFKNFVKDNVREVKKANRQAREA